jgi:hypothetical protein
MQKLRVMALRDLQLLRDVQGLQECPDVRAVELRCCEELQQVDLSLGLSTLHQLQVVECGKLTQLPGLERLTALQQLQLQSCQQLCSVDLGGLAALWRLDIRACGALQEVDVVGLSSLQQLRIINCGSLQQVPGLTGLRQLGRLKILDCPVLPVLPGVNLQGLTEVRAFVDDLPKVGLPFMFTEARRWCQCCDSCLNRQ